ncbi:MAG: FlaD/FlaE family flagellar protein, partial [Candidatus Thermoplasmatota archaeon]
LMDRCGRHNLPNVLDYYVDIGWISEEAKINLLEYSNGITEEKPEQDDRDIKELPSKDHIQSFLFIQKLKGNSFDKHFLDRIEDKITRMTKKIDYRYNR